MKKLLIASLTALLTAPVAGAHELWVQTGHTHGGEVLEAEIGYGHNFHPVTIPAERVHFFREGMSLVTDEGTQKLVQDKEKNYLYRTAAPVKEGSYLVTATYQPTFWSKNAAGEWAQKNLQGMPDAVYCEQTQMFGKNVLNVGHDSFGKGLVARPLGHTLEIVPLDNPSAHRVGEAIPMQILFGGEPLADATVTATFEGFDTSYKEVGHAAEAQAFSKQTDAQGKVDILPLRQGLWKVKVIHKTDYPNAKECQKLAAYATLTFELGAGAH